MPSPNANPTPITPPRVPLIDPRTGLIDRAWYLFFLSLNNIASAVVDSGDIGTDTDSLLASYDAALRSVNQELQTLPPVVTLPAPDVLGDLFALPWCLKLLRCKSRLRRCRCSLFLTLA